jgi:DNA-binding MarR family transcriptional regulator
MDAIRRIVRALRETSRAAEQRFGLSAAQLFVLHQLDGRGAQTIGELAAATATHQSSVSVVVQRLVDAGLVKRTTSSSDRRRRQVALTPRGKKLLGRVPDLAQERLLAGLAALPPAELRQLADHLTALVAAMGAEGEPATMFFEDGAPPRARSPRARRG